VAESSYRIHRPVRNVYAHSYVLLVLLSFAISVVGTRLFLEITGYPQLGNDTLHIAHALWGGLLLVVASGLTLTYLNQWVFRLAAICAGTGVGLFIDEVGKFITQTNDYFFPLAAPLIYVFFLLAVFVYLYVRRGKTTDARAEMYAVLSVIQEVLDDNLEVSEREYLIERLRHVQRTGERRDLSALATALLQFIESDAAVVIPDQSTLYQRLMNRWQAFEDRVFTRRTMRWLIVLALALVSVSAITQLTLLTSLLFDRDALDHSVFLLILETNPLVRGPASFQWFLVSIALELLMGGLLVVSLLLMLRGWETAAIRFGSSALVLSLTINNILKFYFNQFSVVAESILLFLVLMMLLRYQNRFLADYPPAL